MRDMSVHDLFVTCGTHLLWKYTGNIMNYFGNYHKLPWESSKSFWQTACSRSCLIRFTSRVFTRFLNDPADETIAERSPSLPTRFPQPPTHLYSLLKYIPVPPSNRQENNRSLDVLLEKHGVTMQNCPSSKHKCLFVLESGNLRLNMFRCCFCVRRRRVSGKMGCPTYPTMCQPWAFL